GGGVEVDAVLFVDVAVLLRQRQDAPFDLVRGRAGRLGGKPLHVVLAMARHPVPSLQMRHVAPLVAAAAIFDRESPQGKGGVYAGMRMMARRPPSGLSSSVMSPPWLRAMSRAIDRPRPVPLESWLRAWSRRTNGLKTSSRLAGGMPGPSSSTVMTSNPFACSMFTLTFLA